MAFRNTSPGNEVINNSGFGDTLKTLLRVGGGWGTVRSVILSTECSCFSLPRRRHVDLENMLEVFDLGDANYPTFAVVLRPFSMLRVIISGSLSSLCMGMAGASIGALIYDTATIPFLVSACSGFVLGAVGFYRDAVRKSLRSLDRYPRLLQLHLDANFPHRGFETWPGDRFRSGVFRSSWVLQSMLVASWLTAAKSIDRILDAEEEAILLPHTQPGAVAEAEVEVESLDKSE